MNKAFTILAVAVAFFVLLYSPKILSEFYLWNASLSEFFAERAYYVALNLGADNLHRDGTTLTLQNGKHVYVAFTCVDLFMIGFNTALPFTVFILVLVFKNIFLTLPQAIIIFLIMLLASILMNVIRIAVLLYLANNYYETFVQPVGWWSFHDTIGFAIMMFHTLIWLIIALAI